MCREVLPNETLENSMKLKLNRKNVLLPIHRIVARSRGIYAGVIDGTVTNDIIGKLPNHIIVVLLSNGQISGTLATNPFFFGPRNLKEFSLVINGQNLPNEKISFNTAATDSDTYRAYSHLMNNIGMGDDCDSGITPDLHKTNSFAMAWDLTPDSCLNNHLHETENSGSVDIRLVFNQPTPTPLIVLYLATYDNTITLSHDKTVKTDFNV